MEAFDWSALLGKSLVFGRLTDAEVQDLLKASEEVSYDKSAIILKEGAHSEQLFLIGEGQASVTLTGVEGHHLPIDSLSAGEFFGEMAWIEKKPRMATIIADSPCRILQFPAAEFQRLMDSNALFASKVSIMLSERLRKITEGVLAVSLKDVDERLALSNTKLDASLKAVESQMKAADTVFSQTSTRAGEVIESYDRMRSQMMTVGAGLSVFLSLLAGLAAFFGWSEWKSVAKLMEDSSQTVAAQVAEIKQSNVKTRASMIKMDEDLTSINKTRQKVQALKDQMQNDIGDLRAQADKIRHKSTTSGDISKFLTIQFAGILEAQGKIQHSQIALYRTLVEYHIDDIILDASGNHYLAIMTLRDSQTTEQLFRQVIHQLTDTEKSAQYRGQISRLISTSLNKGDALSEQQKALSYYFLVAAALIEGQPDQYKAANTDINTFIDFASQSVRLADEFRPQNWFEPYLRKRGDAQLQQKAQYLDDVWNRLKNS